MGGWVDRLREGSKDIIVDTIVWGDDGHVEQSYKYILSRLWTPYFGEIMGM